MCYCLKLCGQTFGSLFLMTVTYFGKKSLNLIPQRLHLESNSKSCLTPNYNSTSTQSKHYHQIPLIIIQYSANAPGQFQFRL